MGMRFSLSPWPRKRGGEPELDVVVSPPGNGPSVPSGLKSSAKGGGDGPKGLSEVGGKYVGWRGSEWEKDGEKEAFVRKETHPKITEKCAKLRVYRHVL